MILTDFKLNYVVTITLTETKQKPLTDTKMQPVFLSSTSPGDNVTTEHVYCPSPSSEKNIHHTGMEIKTKQQQYIYIYTGCF